MRIALIIHQAVREAVLELAIGLDQTNHLVNFHPINECQARVAQAVEMLKRGFVVREQSLERRPQQPATDGNRPGPMSPKSTVSDGCRGAPPTSAPMTSKPMSSPFSFSIICG